MWRFWRSKKAKSSASAVKFDWNSREEPAVAAMLTMRTSIINNVCPDCGNKTGFWESANRGISTNIECVNPECGSMFNVSPYDVERISKASPKKRV